MAQSRYYSSNAQPTTLAAGVTPSSTTCQISAAIGLPATTPYVLALDYNTSSEELVLVTAQAGTNLTITRAFDGTSAASHGGGAPVRHVWCGADGNDSRAHEGSSAAVHGVTGNLVGDTDIQTLSNKTLASPTSTGTDTVNGVLVVNNQFASAASSVLAVNGASGQTGNLLSIRDNLANAIFTVGATGSSTLNSTNTAQRPLNVNGPLGLTANLLGLRVNNVDVFTVNAAGNYTASGTARNAIETPTLTVTAQTGWGSPVVGVRRSGQILDFSVNINRTGANITASATGDITDSPVFQIDQSAFFPANIHYTMMSATTYFGGGSLSSSGLYTLQSLAPTATIATGNTIGFTFCYVIS